MNKEVKKVEETKEIKATTIEAKLEDTTSEVLKEVLALKKELEALKKEKLSFSDAEKRAIEEARDEMLTDDDIGQVFLDDKYKEDGFVYRCVDTTRQGRVAKLLKIGYSIVEDSEAKTGQSIVGKSSHLGAAVTQELGRDRGSCLGVWMKIPKDRYDERQKAKVRRNQKDTAEMLAGAVSRSDFGTITIGNDTYKK